MTLDEILQDIHALEEDMLTYERKYGVLSETFYESYINGEEPPDDTWVLDWNDWAATYEIWLKRSSSLIAPNCRRATIDSCAVASARG